MNDFIAESFTVWVG